MARKKRNWHPDFVKYTEYIVNHPNYHGLEQPFGEDGKIKWVIAGNSEIGKKRAEWWDIKVQEMALSKRSDVARAIHPKELEGLKPCQICGKKLNIFYVYPKKTILTKLNKETGLRLAPYAATIDDIFKKLYTDFPGKEYEILKKVFKITKFLDDEPETLLNYIKENERGKLSPGVMCNPPDRFDGFHTYNGCCRAIQDTGRHKSNLARYTQDRRAYENWAEGNWNYANRNMGEFGKYKTKHVCPSCSKTSFMTADHIGPISLGFTHRPQFNPLCKECNSKKNNRMTYEDVKQILEDEKKGEKVISWHSSFIWNKLKNEVNSKSDALKLSKILGNNLQNVLYIFAKINEAGGQPFLLRYLNPEYSYSNYYFKDFNPLDLSQLKVTIKPCSSKNRKKNATRYIRISFESLKEYLKKTNRRAKLSKLITPEELYGINKLVEQKKYEKADKKIKNLIEKVGTDLSNSFFN